MAGSSKRKKGAAQSPEGPSNKRRKTAQTAKKTAAPDPPPHDPDKLWKLRTILAETKTHYRISWENDPDTGEKYAPTWTPKDFVNEQAIEHWEGLKAARATKTSKSTKRASPATGKSRRKSRPSATTPAQKKRPSFPSLSSQASSSRPSSRAQQIQGTEETDSESESVLTELESDGEPEIEESQQSQHQSDQNGESSLLITDENVTNDDAPEEPQDQAFVQQPDPPSSYLKGEYLKVPVGIDESQTAPTRTGQNTQSTSGVNNQDLNSESTPRRSERRAFVQHPDPPSSWLAGAYHRVSSASANNAAPQAETPESFAPVAATTNGSQTTQAASPLKSGSSRTIPDSQSQQSQEYLDSTFQGLSPGGTQKAAADVTSSDSQRSQQHTQRGVGDSQPESGIDLTAASQASAGTGRNGEASEAFPESDRADFAASKGSAVAKDIAHTLRNSLSAGTQHAAPPESQISANRLSSPGLNSQPTGEHVQREESSTNTSSKPSTPKASLPQIGAFFATVEQSAVRKSPRRAKPSSRLVRPLGQQSAQTEVETSSEQPAQKTVHAREEAQTITSSSTEPSSFPISSSIRPPLEKDYEPPTPAQRPPPSPSYQNSSLPVTEKEADAVEVLKSLRILRDFSSPVGGTQLPNSASKHRRDNHSDSTLSRSRTPSTSNSDRIPPNTRPGQSPLSSSIPSVPSRAIAGRIGDSAPKTFESFSSDTSFEKDTMPTSALKEKLQAQAAERQASIRAKAAARQAARSSSSTPNSQAPPIASALPPNISAELAASTAIPDAGQIGSPSSAALAVNESSRSPSAIPALEPQPVISKEDMLTSERYGSLLPGSDAEMRDLRQSAINESMARPAEPENREDPELASAHVVPVPLPAAGRDAYLIRLRNRSHKALMERVVAEQDLSEELLAQANALLDELRDIVLHPDLRNPETASQIAEAEFQARWDATSSAKFRFIQELLDEVKASKLHVAIAAQGVRIPHMLEIMLRALGYPVHRISDPDQIPTASGHHTLKVSVVDLDDDAVAEFQAVDVVVAVDALVNPQHPKLRALRRRENGSWSTLLTLVVPHTVEHVQRCLQPDMPPAARTRLLIKASRELQHEAGRLEHTQASSADAAAAVALFIKGSQATWPIAGLTQLDELDSQTETELSGSSGVKRAYDMDIDSDSTKRARLSASPAQANHLPVTINPQELDVTHISDSMGTATQSNDAKNVEKDLKAALDYERTRYDEHLAALEDLQYRFEQQRIDLVEVTRERDAAIAKIEEALVRKNGAEASNMTLRDERKELKEALASATNRLQSHEIPAKREFEALHTALNAARAEKEKAEKRVAAAEKAVEYTRSTYQDSSRVAQELNERVQALQTQLDEALVKASSNSARVREISAQGHNKALELENQKLKQIIKSHEAAMKLKDEKLKDFKEASRGRIGTRQGSVPRSPRNGSPVKGRASRAASPAVGDGKGRSGASHLHPSALRKG